MSNRIASGFDLLAPMYDRLARTFIGNEIQTSQLHFLPRLGGCARILILGGGTGWLLDHLCNEDQRCEIDYIDISPQMLAAAKQRKHKRVNFIEGTEADIPQRNYDGVVTNFYLDMFDEEGLHRRMETIKMSLANTAQWLVTDFLNERNSHAFRLWLMYRFFRVMTNIQASRLSDWQALIREAGLVLQESSTFANGFIASNLYRYRNS